MEELRSTGDVEYLSYGFTKSNMLSYVTWSFSDSKRTGT